MNSSTVKYGLVRTLLGALVAAAALPHQSYPARAAPQACPAAPAGLPDMIDGANFCVYYNTTDPAPSDPDLNGTTSVQAAFVADQTQRYWDRYVTEFDFRVPLFTDKLQVRILNNAVCNGGTGPALTFLEVYNGCFDTNEEMQGVAGHELFHRVQYSYDGVEVKWFKEGTARAIQDNTFDNIDNWPNALGSGSSFNTEANNYLVSTNADITSDFMRYESALWWKYFTEQFGHTTGEPQLGVDALRRLWEAAATQNDVAAVNTALTNLGAGVNFNTAFRRFALANWVKDLSGAPTTLNYVDEDQPGNPAPYGPIIPTSAGTVNVGAPVAVTIPNVSRYGARYVSATPGASCPVITVNFETVTGPDVFYHVVTQDGGNALQTTVEGSSLHWTPSFLNAGTARVVAIVGGQANSAENVTVTFSCNNPTLTIQLPNDQAKAYVGDGGNLLAQVLVTNGTPNSPVLGGLTRSDFRARVNGLPADVINGGFILEQYWLVIDAPNGLANGTYDLEVSLRNPSGGPALVADTNTLSVVYDADRSDHVLVLDRSGSMGEGNKFTAAKSAAGFYIDILRNNEGVAVVPYSTDATPLAFPMQQVNPAVRTNARNYVRDLVLGDLTSIGDGLQGAVAQRAASTTANPRCSFVLLSDGVENDPVYWADVRASVQASGCPVTTIAFGPSTNEALMQTIATETGGQFFFNDVFVSSASEPTAIISDTDSSLKLANAFEYILARDEGRERLLAERGTIVFPTVEKTHTVTIDSSVTEALFALDWVDPAANLQLYLRKPDGSVLGPNSPPYTFQDASSGHLGWRIQNPAPGKWELTILYPGNAQITAPYQVLVSGRSNVSLDVLLPDRTGDTYYTGNRVPIYAFLSGSSAITNTNLEALVTAQGGKETNVPLFDDGKHNDGRAGDGFYAGSFTRVITATASSAVASSAEKLPVGANKIEASEASYRVVVRAQNTNIQRETLGSFTVQQGVDANGNSLPDPFEQEYKVSNPDLDPDLDGLDNLSEFYAGTDPHVSDTDGDGENDGSEELLHSQDPISPTDGKIKAPEFLQVAPSSGAVTVTYDVKTGYQQMLLYRATSLTGTWALRETDAPLSGTYTDTATNGTTYFYRLIAVDKNNHRSAVLTSAAVTPKQDAQPPEAQLLINNGAAATAILTVTLGFVPYEDGSAAFTDITQMLISNDSGFAGAAWQPFTKTVAWVLPAVAAGSPAKVYARFRDGAGNESLTEVGTIFYKPLVLNRRTYLPIVVK